MWAMDNSILPLGRTFRVRVELRELRSLVWPLGWVRDEQEHSIDSFPLQCPQLVIRREHQLGHMTRTASPHSRCGEILYGLTPDTTLGQDSNIRIGAGANHLRHSRRPLSRSGAPTDLAQNSWHVHGEASEVALRKA